MKNQKKLLEIILSKNGIINLILAFSLIVALAAVTVSPNNPYAILSACTSGGLMNAMIGLRMMKDPKKKSVGMSYVMMGFILILLGFILIQYVL